MKKIYCPAPWKSMFYHTDKVSVCCINQEKLSMSPEDFLKSDHLKKLKEKFSKNEYDDSCVRCKVLEEQGLQSIRKHYLQMYGHSTEEELSHLELRTSNLCNFECKMCNSENSSLIAGRVFSISEENFNQILKISEKLKTLVLTGGEPFLIKHYYTLLDHLIEKENFQLKLKIYTNASVYNKIFIDKILKFNSTLAISIDGVNEVAEIQRKGTKWSVVQNNIEEFLKLPLDVHFHSTFTSLSIRGVDSLAKYFSDILHRYPRCTFMVHTAIEPKEISLLEMQDKLLIKESLESIDRAIPFLNDFKFTQFKKQLFHYKTILSKN
jgi:sulfatase maturation enzyme AslB (radical SAM superfamily)